MDERLAAWIRERPDCIRALILQFPPGCSVIARRPLVTPGRGEIGTVVSYTEDGDVSVVVPGNPTRGFCRPWWLGVVAYMPGVTLNDVAAVFAAKDNQT